jgi:hypothetical protein
MIEYPKELPLGLHSGRTYQLISPLMRSQLDSGRARQRRRFKDVPEGAQISWLFSSTEARAFAMWFRDAINDGVLWFECPLNHPVLGLTEYTCRFTDVYKGPARVGPDLWSVTAELELRERAQMPEDWGLFPGFIIDAGILDYAMNREWPLQISYALTTQDGFILTTEDGFGLTTE